MNGAYAGVMGNSIVKAPLHLFELVKDRYIGVREFVDAIPSIVRTLGVNRFESILPKDLRLVIVQYLRKSHAHDKQEIAKLVALENSSVRIRQQIAAIERRMYCTGAQPADVGAKAWANGTPPEYVHNFDTARNAGTLVSRYDTHRLKLKRAEMPYLRWLFLDYTLKRAYIRARERLQKQQVPTKRDTRLMRAWQLKPGMTRKAVHDMYERKRARLPWWDYVSGRTPVGLMEARKLAEAYGTR